MPRNFMFYIIFLIGMLLDQSVKIFVRKTMELGQSIRVIDDFFKITYIENEGVAFGIGQGNVILMYIMPLIFLVSGYYLWYKYGDRYGKLITVGAAMIISGGMSNLIDRLIFKSVTDYFDLRSFAVFNIADILIDVGMVMVIIAVFFSKEKCNE